MLGDGDTIQQMVTRSGADIAQIGLSSQELGGVGALDGGTSSILGPDFRSPWLRDQVSLSLEAQIAMIESRANYKLTLADLGYTNRQKVLELRPGIYCKVEPTGCYKLAYNDR